MFGFSMGFQAFEVMFFLVFALVFGIILVTAIRGLLRWNKNNHSPRLTVDARVVGKRTDITHHRHGNMDHPGHCHTSSSYYVTFQVASGDRMEFSVSGGEYGMLIEGDAGELSFQGLRYLGFVRK